MSASRSIIGQVFNRLRVVSRTDDRAADGSVVWACQCSCGKSTSVATIHLTSGHTRSCGCWKHEVNNNRFKTHDEAKTYLYRTWSHAKARCHNPTDAAYEDYGGRGISMAPEWRESYVAFALYVRQNLGERPTGLTLDRENNDQGYVPGNIRWANSKMQANNRRRARRAV